MVDFAIVAVEAVIPKLGVGGTMGGGLAVFTMEAVMPKSGIGGSMGGRLSNYCDGSSYAEIEH